MPTPRSSVCAGASPRAASAPAFLDSKLEPDYIQFLARMVDQPGAMLVLLRVVVRRLVVQIGVKADSFVRSIVLDEERVRVFTGTPKTARIGGALF